MEASGIRPAGSALVATLVATALLALGAGGIDSASAARRGAPSDRGFAAQWQLATDRPMGVRSAWRITTGGDAVVAVLDTGADLGHPDLAPNLWTNPDEIPGNGRDDDGNGFADDVHGHDFADGDADPSDDHGHGTHVAGVIAARGDNGLGMTGVAWRARLMIVRVLDTDGSGEVGDVARGIRYAVANGARVINLSMAGPDTSPELEAAILEAQAAGAVVVASAGNTGDDLDLLPAYPAASAGGAPVAVASTDATGALAADSSFGARAVDLTAPGESIGSTAAGGGYEIRSGTSQAAAQVSGAVALMLTARPTATGDELRAALIAGARARALHAGRAIRRLLNPGAPVFRRATTSRARPRAIAAEARPLTVA